MSGLHCAIMSEKKSTHLWAYLWTQSSENWEVIIQINKALKQMEIHGWLQSKQVFIHKQNWNTY